ncbi:PIR protein CIR protein [Plasmodium vinckei]|uniref:PIR protein CIR protein n=1 Tax=Plasmodium vinckei TaxID=5860 RepID=A0A6V7SFA7_PLAVN|nr:PIR protein CIR protein [Plasmodium vinckei]
MANPSYNVEAVYKDIYTINNYFTEYTQGNLIFQSTDPKIHDYCHYMNNSGKGRCPNYIEKASSGVIYVLKSLEKYGLEYDKLAEYAILWLRYKLNQKAPYHTTNLNDFYINHIEKNNDYNKIKVNGLTCKEIIDKKKDLMNINEMTKFSYPFSILLFLYSEINKKIPNCTKHLGQAKDFDTRFKEFNNDSNNIEGSSYNKLLSTLSNDYNHLKKRYYDKNQSCDFPSLPELTPKKSIAQNRVEIPVKNPGKGSKQILGHTSDVTSSSSSISTTLIPALSVFSVIPVFLGIAYKTIYKKKIKKSKEENET